VANGPNIFQMLLVAYKYSSANDTMDFIPDRSRPDSVWTGLDVCNTVAHPEDGRQQTGAGGEQNGSEDE